MNAEEKLIAFLANPDIDRVELQNLLSALTLEWLQKNVVAENAEGETTLRELHARFSKLLFSCYELGEVVGVHKTTRTVNTKAEQLAESLFVICPN